MSITSNLKAAILKMPELPKAEAAAWLACQGGGIEWMFEEIVRRGWVRRDENDPAMWKAVPPKPRGVGVGDGRGAQALTIENVAEQVAMGKVKANEIAVACMARYTVSRRTVNTRLKDAVLGGVLVKGARGGTYALAQNESVD